MIAPLQERFRLGIYTSSSYHTVREVIPLLERAAGDGDPLFDDPSIVLHRGHTQVSVTTARIARNKDGFLSPSGSCSTLDGGFGNSIIHDQIERAARCCDQVAVTLQGKEVSLLRAAVRRDPRAA